MNTVVNGVIMYCNAVFSTLISLLSRISESMTSKLLRIYRHEISHLTLGLRHIFEYKLKDVNKMRLLSDNDICEMNKNALSSIEQMQVLTSNIKTIIGNSNNELEVKEVFFYNNILCKWTNTYSQLVKNKQMKFSYPTIDMFDPNCISFKTNASLLDQILYNLIDNAIKYSHWGTNIHINCVKQNEHPFLKILSVTSYGIAINNDDTPYHIYSRGELAKETSADGSGIGLYIVNKIGNILGGQVKHNSILISELNVPLLESYIYGDFTQQKEKILEELAVKELKRLSDANNTYDQVFQLNNLFDDIVNNDIRYNSSKQFIYKLSELKILDNIVKPTYKNTFEVII